jgi:hypothetical protein
LKFPAISALSAVFWRRFALQFQRAADDSLLCMEQGILVAGSGKFSSEQGIADRCAAFLGGRARGTEKPSRTQ